jgi:ribosomal protein S7
MVTSARKKKSNLTISKKLAAEITDAFYMTGGAFNQKEIIQKEAMANPSFTSFSNT